MTDSERFTDPSRPAATIRQLLRHLRAMDGADGRFLYRGQVKEYPAPLLPSVYRRMAAEPVYGPHSPEYRYALRGIGRRFVGNLFLSFQQQRATDFPPDIPHDELAVVHALQT